MGFKKKRKEEKFPKALSRKYNVICTQSYIEKKIL